jgi:hypothetical protein
VVELRDTAVRHPHLAGCGGCAQHERADRLAAGHIDHVWVRALVCSAVRSAEAHVVDGTGVAVCPQQPKSFSLALDRGAREGARCHLTVAAPVAGPEVAVDDRDDAPDEQAAAHRRCHLTGVQKSGVLVVVARMEMSEELFVIALRDAR